MVNMRHLMLRTITVTLTIINTCTYGKEICDINGNLTTYNPKIYTCCGGQLSRKQESVSCCRDQLYNKNLYVCCGNELLDKRNKGVARKCCGDRLHNETQNTICCGDIQINATTHFCCTNKPVLKSSGMDCCFDEPFNPTTHHCVDDIVIPVTEGKCGSTTYNAKSSMICCDEKLHNTSQMKEPVECCGKELYSKNSQKCCKATNFRAPKDEDCCGQGSINLSSHLCCNGVKYSRTSANLACCGNQTYINGSSEDCCGGERTAHYRRVHNKTKERCCGGETLALLDEDCCRTDVYSKQQQSCCNKNGKFILISKTSRVDGTLRNESNCPGYRFAKQCDKIQLKGHKELCKSSTQKITERKKTRNRNRHGVCRICSLNTNSLLRLIKKQKSLSCNKKVILLAVDAINRVGRYRMLNVTASYPSHATEETAEFKLKVLLPCRECSKLQTKSKSYLLLTQSRVRPGKLLRLGDSDFLFPSKSNITEISSWQAKCKSHRNVDVRALKERMRKRIKKFLNKLLRF
ncbi:uncharacterized protein LOC134256819 [Saccostrea cucullata]|uniref:uncharacterized protein LOC134256819 n=1 Tax=Saccostrea cuccullata TaxID=36930 RepID=UPI002ED407D5